MLNNEQSAMNLLSVDDDDDLLWTWLIEQVELIIAGKPFETKMVLQEDLFESSMEIAFKENRIYVDMNSFGFGLQYSWEICQDAKGNTYLGHFQIESFPFEEGGIANGSKE